MTGPGCARWPLKWHTGVVRWTHRPMTQGSAVDTVDQHGRRVRFEAAHPEWRIISPKETRSVLRGELAWRALGPGDQFVREYELRHLLDQLDKLT